MAIAAASIERVLNNSAFRGRSATNLHEPDAGVGSPGDEPPLMELRSTSTAEGRKLVRGVIAGEGKATLRQVAEIAIWATDARALLGGVVRAEDDGEAPGERVAAPSSPPNARNAALAVSMSDQALERAEVLEVVINQIVTGKITGSRRTDR